LRPVSSWVLRRRHFILERRTCYPYSTRVKVSTTFRKFELQLTMRFRGRNTYRVALLRTDSSYWLLWFDRSRCFRWYGRTPWNCRLAMAVHSVGIQVLILCVTTNLHRSEGAVTAVVAIFGFFLLPNTHLTTSWLTPEERELAHARMERDRVGDSSEPVSSMEGLRQACRDPRTWLFCFMQNFHLSACSFNSFFPT
jgi:hypothetical protein